jgi:hypothetical protein
MCFDTESRSEKELDYSFSKPWDVNFSVRRFSVTIRTTVSGVPVGMVAAISNVTFTDEPIKWAITSSAIRVVSRPTLAGSRVTLPWNRFAASGLIDDVADGAPLAPVAVVNSGCTVPALPFTVDPVCVVVF